MMMRRVIKGGSALLATLAILPGAVCRGSEYDRAAESIVGFAREAAKWRNAGDVARAALSVAEAERAFDAATRLDDANPQAYFNAANAALNTERFERAIELWDRARDRLGSDAASEAARAHLEERVESSWLGLFSVGRDEAYANEDVRKALDFAQLQHELMPLAPPFLHDAATLESTLAEVGNGDVDLARAADADFRRARELAAGSAALYLGLEGAELKVYAAQGPDEGGGGNPLTYGPFVEAGAPRIALVEDAYFAGPDAVVVKLRQSTLEVYGGEAPWVEVHANLWLAQTWRRSAGVYDHSGTKEFVPPGPGLPRHVKRTSKAASAMGFASRNYYHFLTDVLPRAVALVPVLRADASVKLVVPKTGRKLSTVLRLALHADGSVWDGRLVELDTARHRVPPGPRLLADKLHAVEWARVTFRDGRPTHALTPAPLLRAARAAVLDGHGEMLRHHHQAQEPAEEKPYVVYVARRAAKTRLFANETALLEGLRAGLQEDGHAHDAVRVFDHTVSAMEEDIHLFRYAAAVVGVHGAGLANVLWCAPGTALVELGFANIFATASYEHLAAAMGLDYDNVRLAPDDRTVNARHVAVDGPALAAAVGRVRTALNRASSSRNDDGGHHVHSEL